MVKGKHNRFLLSPLSSTIYGGLVVFIISSAITSLAQKINILEGILVVSKLILGVVKAFLLYKIPLWSVLLGVGVIFLIILLISHVADTKNKNQTPNWYNYTYRKWVNRHGEWLFTWNYNGNRIVNLRAICSNCKCELSLKSSDRNYTSDYYILHCPRCNSVFPEVYDEEIEDVRKIITHDINTGYWRNFNDSGVD